jgi:hypothetical protein
MTRKIRKLLTFVFILFLNDLYKDMVVKEDKDIRVPIFSAASSFVVHAMYIWSYGLSMDFPLHESRLGHLMSFVKVKDMLRQNFLVLSPCDLPLG